VHPSRFGVGAVAFPKVTFDSMLKAGDIIEASLIEAFAAFGADPSFKVKRERDHVRTVSAVDIPFLNNVFGFPQGSLSSRRRLKQIAENFSEKGLGSIWSFLTPNDAHPDLLHTFPEYGFSFSAKLPGMLMGHHVPPPFPSELEVIEVSSDSLMQEWCRVWSAVYDPNRQISTYFASLFEACGQYRNPAFRFFIGQVSGETVSCISSYDDGKALGLFNGATLEGFRQRGYGAAVVSHCLERARRHPSFPAYNIASTQGFSVWQKIGFEKVCEFHQFYLPPVSPLTASGGGFRPFQLAERFLKSI